MAETAKWYVVHTYSAYENKVATNIEKVVENRKLHDLIHAVKIPTEVVTEVGPDNKMREVERKLFPGYVLVKMVMTDEVWHLIRNIRGVTGFVGSANKAIPLSEDEVLALGVEKHEIVVLYHVGDTVRITDGDRLVGEVEGTDLTIPVADPVLWNAEKPYLYELLFEYFAHFFGKSLVAVARKIRFWLLVF